MVFLEIWLYIPLWQALSRLKSKSHVRNIQLFQKRRIASRIFGACCDDDQIFRYELDVIIFARQNVEFTAVMQLAVHLTMVQSEGDPPPK